MSRTRRARRFAMPLLVLTLGGVAGCVRDKPPPAPPKPTTGAPPATLAPMRDLTGKQRDARRGITPGALEAEGAPPPPPEEKAENSNGRS